MREENKEILLAKLGFFKKIVLTEEFYIRDDIYDNKDYIIVYSGLYKRCRYSDGGKGWFLQSGDREKGWVSQSGDWKKVENIENLEFLYESLNGN